MKGDRPMYNDFNNYNVNPYNPYMQPNYNMQQRALLKGRVVSNIEEARSALIDMDGSITFFPCLSENCIYTKAIDLNGQAIFKTYKLMENNPAVPQYANANVVQQLEERITKLESLLKDKENENVKSNA